MQGRRGKTALVWVLNSTVVRFLDLVQTGREKIILVTVAALCYFLIARGLIAGRGQVGLISLVSLEVPG